MATINMHMKFEIEIPKQTWLMLWKPCRLQTDGRTDGQTDKVNPVYPPSNFIGRGYNNVIKSNKVKRTTNIKLMWLSEWWSYVEPSWSPIPWQFIQWLGPFQKWFMSALFKPFENCSALILILYKIQSLSGYIFSHVTKAVWACAELWPDQYFLWRSNMLYYKIQGLYSLRRRRLISIGIPIINLSSRQTVLGL